MQSNEENKPNDDWCREAGNQPRSCRVAIVKQKNDYSQITRNRYKNGLGATAACKHTQFTQVAPKSELYLRWEVDEGLEDGCLSNCQLSGSRWLE